MSIERINPAELARPSGFSHAMAGRGTLVLLAGQTALDPAGRITGTGVVAQFEVALGNLLTALAAASRQAGPAGLADRLRRGHGRLPAQLGRAGPGLAAAGRAGLPGYGRGRRGPAVGRSGPGGGPGHGHPLSSDPGRP